MLKVMTLNLNSYGTKYGPWHEREQLICEAIEAASPDVIALQAVRADPAVADGLDQATQLARDLREYGFSIFQSAAQLAGGAQEGSALLARTPATATTFRPLTLLPNLDDQNQRLVLVSRLDLASGPLSIFNCHFSWVEEQAALNVEEALPYISSFDGRGLLVGDLNNSPDSAAMKRIAAQGWTDSWKQLHRDRPGFTFESNAPSMRIDFAWANAALAPRVREIEIVADSQSPGGARPSDHLGLLVTLDL